MSRARAGEWLVLAVLSGLALYHSTLLGQGALAFPDEHLYRKALDSAQAITDGEFSKAAASLSGWGSRPAEYLARLPAAFAQLAAQHFTGLSPLSPASLPIVTAQNVLVSFLLGLAFLRVSQRLLSPSAAVLATIAFSLLTVNHVWVRHVVPYDVALLAHLLALRMGIEVPLDAPAPGFLRRALVGGGLAVSLILIYPVAFHNVRSLGLPIAVGVVLAIGGLALWLGRTEPRTAYRRALQTGLISGLALAFYPAYYSFVPALGIFIVLGGRTDRVFAVSAATLRNGVVFASGASLVVFAFEVLARLGEVSYLGGARLLASTITQGAFDEGFVFLAKWLWAVDASAAMWLLPAGGAGAILLFWARLANGLAGEGAVLARLCSILGGFYLVYGFQSVVLHRMVFTGRYARIYLPVLLWLAAYGLSRIAPSGLRHGAFALAGALSVASFGQFAASYREVGYPADVLRALRIGYEDVTRENVRHEFAILPNYNLPVKAMTEAAPYVTVPGDKNYILFNFALPGLDEPALPELKKPGRDILIHDSLHFCSFTSTAWEGYPEAKRTELTSRRYRLLVFRRQADGGPSAPQEISPVGIVLER
jgi:hypothetical protein